jgi:type II secretory pathway pseudopilin PulG
MFSLIITIISIALVAALAVATIYYGGDTFRRSGLKAEAAKVVTSGMQINGAMQVYKAQNSAYPSSLDELVSANLLRSIPKGEWAMIDDYIIATGIKELQCVEANRQLGITGPIPACTDAAITSVTACCSTPDV